MGLKVFQSGMKLLHERGRGFFFVLSEIFGFINSHWFCCAVVPYCAFSLVRTSTDVEVLIDISLSERALLYIPGLSELPLGNLLLLQHINGGKWLPYLGYVRTYDMYVIERSRRNRPRSAWHCGVRGVFSWNTAAGLLVLRSRQCTQLWIQSKKLPGTWYVFYHGLLSASHNLFDTLFFPPWASVAGGVGRPGSEVPCIPYIYMYSSSPAVVPYAQQ